MESHSITVDQTAGQMNWLKIRKKWLKTNPNQLNLKDKKHESITKISNIVAAGRKSSVISVGDTKDLVTPKSSVISGGDTKRLYTPRNRPKSSSSTHSTRPVNGGDSKSVMSVRYSSRRPKTATPYLSKSQQATLLQRRATSGCVLRDKDHDFDHKHFLGMGKKDITSFEYLHILMHIWQPQLSKSYRSSAVESQEDADPLARARAAFRSARRKILMINLMKPDDSVYDDNEKIKKILNNACIQNVASHAGQNIK